MKKPLQLAVMGAGLAGRRHMQAIAKSQSCQLSAIIDPDNQTKEIAKKANCLWFPSLKNMFAKMRPDGLIIATPSNLHAQHGIEAIQQQCPILVEKPITTTLDDAKTLIEAAKHHHVAIAVGHHRRHMGFIQKAHHMIKHGDLGDIRAIQGQCWLYKPDDYFEIAPWRQKKGAGPISVNLIHDIDILRYLCGDVVSVFADAVQAKRGYENEEVASILLRFENDILCTLSVSDRIAAPWSWELTAHENPIYPQTQESCYLIGGSEKSLSLPDFTLWQHRGKKSWWEEIHSTQISVDENDPFIAQIEQFASVIRKEEAPLVSGDEGLKALQVIEAIYQSIETGAQIS